MALQVTDPLPRATGGWCRHCPVWPSRMASPGGAREDAYSRRTATSQVADSCPVAVAT